MTIFKSRIFSVSGHLEGEKMDCCFNMYAQSYAYFKLCEQKLT